MLDLRDLSLGLMPGVTAETGASLAQAAGVCLESQGHAQGVNLRVRGDRRGNHELHWPLVTPQAQRSWANEDNATEDGAAGVAVLLAREEIGYVVVERANRGTGFDYWLGSQSEEVAPYEAKMEVSGIRNGDETDIRRRVREKMEQIARPVPPVAPNLPAYAVVTEFSRPVAEIRESTP